MSEHIFTRVHMSYMHVHVKSYACVRADAHGRATTSAGNSVIDENAIVEQIKVQKCLKKHI